VQYSRPDDFPFVQLGLPKNRSAARVQYTDQQLFCI